MLNWQRLLTIHGRAMYEGVAGVTKHCRFVNGPEIRELEEKLCELTGMKHCVCCGSGTAALELALRATHLTIRTATGQPPPVLCQAFTFAAAIEVARHLGIPVKYVDIDKVRFQISPSVRDGATGGMIATELFGIPFPVEKCAYAGPTILDAAQSLGANREAWRAQCVCASFHPSKPLGCLGDGGAVLTNDSTVAADIRCLRNHGQRYKYIHAAWGLNSRLDSLQAAILLARLPRFEEEQARRQTIAHHYCSHLDERIRPAFIPESIYSYFPILAKSTEERSNLIAQLQSQGVKTAIHYPYPLHCQVADDNPEYVTLMEDQLENSIDVSRRILQIPIDPYLTRDEITHITESINSFFRVG